VRFRQRDYVDKPNYFDLAVRGAQGDNAAKYTAEGRPVAIDSRLEWCDWETDGAKRQAIEIVSDSV
jgi:single-strand DNA-binding protein